MRLESCLVVFLHLRRTADNNQEAFIGTLKLTQSSPADFKDGLRVLRGLQLPAIVGAALAAAGGQAGAHLLMERNERVIKQD